jgi:hypothetical protein
MRQASSSSCTSGLRHRKILEAGQPTETWEGYPQGAVETVMVGSSQAKFVRGAVMDGVYEPDTTLYLVWDTADLSIKMIFTARAYYPARLDEAEILDIAASME